MSKSTIERIRSGSQMWGQTVISITCQSSPARLSVMLTTAEGSAVHTQFHMVRTCTEAEFEIVPIYTQKPPIKLSPPVVTGHPMSYKRPGEDGGRMKVEVDDKIVIQGSSINRLIDCHLKHK